MNLTSISNNTAAAYQDLDNKVAALGPDLNPAKLAGLQTAVSKAKTSTDLQAGLVQQSYQLNMSIIGKMV